MAHIDKTNPKGDRALELFEKGLKPAQIGERLGLGRKNISSLIKDAMKRRKRKQEAAE
jgi:DNA-binding CsgD family transcriptional regulator